MLAALLLAYLLEAYGSKMSQAAAQLFSERDNLTTSFVRVVCAARINRSGANRILISCACQLLTLSTKCERLFDSSVSCWRLPVKTTKSELIAPNEKCDYVELTVFAAMRVNDAKGIAVPDPSVRPLIYENLIA